jgi:hypothetical protein
MHMCIYVYIVNAHIHTHIDTYTHTYIHTHRLIHTHIYTHTYTHTHIYIHRNVAARLRKEIASDHLQNSRTRQIDANQSIETTYTHIHTRIYIHMHTHTYTQERSSTSTQRNRVRPPAKLAHTSNRRESEHPDALLQRVAHSYRRDVAGYARHEYEIVY